MKKKVTFKIAVLLTCHNRREKTLRCLHSLFKMSIPNAYLIEVFLVDDGSTDGTSQAVKNLYPQINIIKSDGSLYWGWGMNLAWKKASVKDFDSYLWLNDDLILSNNSLSVLINNFVKSNRKSIIVGACQSSKNEVTYSGYLSLKNNIKLIPNGDIQKCEYFNGNVVLIPYQVFKKVGFIDSKFHHGKGDFDYGLRAKKAGIDSFVSSSYVAICELHNQLPIWCNSNYSILKRWRSFISPLGGNPKANFILERRHFGLVPATLHYFSIYLRLIFPQIWE